MVTIRRASNIIYNNYNNNVTRLIPAYFKVVYTCNTRTYDVNPNWALSEFMEIMTEKIRRDFQIERFELADTNNNLHNVRSEEAPAIIPSNETLASKYGIDLRVAFYIRPIQQDNMYQNRPIQVEQQNNAGLSTNDCIVCREQRNTFLYFGCSHTICQECIDGCNSVGHHTCPICRHARITG
jgi:hypothetical protein